jgi:hypothetical protein
MDYVTISDAQKCRRDPCDSFEGFARERARHKHVAWRKRCDHATVTP